MWILVTGLVGVLVAAAYIILILARAYLYVRVELDAQAKLNAELLHELERLHRQRLIILRTEKRAEMTVPYETYWHRRKRYVVGRN